MKKSLLTMAMGLCLLSSSAQEYRTLQRTDAQGYTYEEVTNDPTHTRVYRLKNGLTVYLSRNVNKPRIQTYIPVRTGSNNDPQEYTGLAHYLEHMLFKGTSKMGSLNWDKERVELRKISDLYEQHKASKDEAERMRLYRQIDSISQIAAQYVAPNEYDRLTTSIGAQGTNAHTWVEETVYKNDIPANELERWLEIESERFDELVLRLFHTEMEAVYEEFNMNQDRVQRRVMAALNERLFPTHPLGQQTTIGTSEHLKSPSLVAIHDYFTRYYTPSNYAIVLVGDLEYDKTIALVDKYFGSKRSHAVEAPKFALEAPQQGVVSHDVINKDPEYLMLAYRRAGGSGSEDELFTTLISAILSNGQAGLIDLNLNQAQAVMQAGTFPQFHKEYSVHTFYAYPKAGQTLEQARDLVLAQIERVKQGDFPDWLIGAIVNDLDLSLLKSYSDRDAVATALYNLYIKEQSLASSYEQFARLRSITKQQVMDYARKHYADNYVIIYKRQGEDKDLIRVQNPGITPLQIDRNALSPFAQQILAQEAPRLKPMWVDYDKAIKRTTVGKLPVEYIINEDNDLFELTYLFDFGSYSHRKLALAIDYLEYLGTDKLTAAEVKQEFYKLGISYSVRSGAERSQVTLSGLKRNMEAGIKLLETLLANVAPDKQALDELRQLIYKERADNKRNKDAIFRELASYARYGEETPTRSALSRAELDAITAEELTSLIRSLTSYQHRVFYYGNDLKGLKTALKRYHKAGTRPAPKAKIFEMKPTGGQVLYADFDMVQAQLLMIRRVDKFDAREQALASLFNAYFGGGMSSIVFQEIREAKSLAYSAYAFYGGANKLNDYNFVQAFVGTQSNKLPEALAAMKALITEMPESQKSFEAAKESALRDIESERITKQDIFWTYERLKRLGITSDNRQAIYNELKTITLSDLRAYFERVIKGNDYTYVLIGREADLPLELMKQFGSVRKMELNYLFGNEE